MNRSLSILAVLCLMLMPLTGCVSDGADGAHDPHDGSTWNVIDISKDDPAYTTADPDSDPGLSFWALHGGCLFFDAHESEHGRELWKMWFDHSIAYN